ncbi:MAG: hypothetical protein KF791_20790 [Verrucomicrobiae bacterium]|nr:hypothetical protein [Verrucomicrobiae bacterium]
MTSKLPAFRILLVAAAWATAVVARADERPGAADPAWHPAIRHPVTTILGRDDGGFWLLDSRADGRGSMSGRLTAVSPVGGVLASAVPAVLPEGSVHCMALVPGGGLVISGSFLSVDGIERPGLARLDSQGRLDPLFIPSVSLDTNVPPPVVGPLPPLPPDPLPPFGIQQIATQPDGGLLVWRFRRASRPDKSPLPWLFRLRNDGAYDDQFQTPKVADGWEVHVLSDGRFITGEDATIYREGWTGLPQQRLLRWFSDGRPDEGFAPVLVGGGSAYAFLEQGDRLLIAGDFAEVNNLFRDHLARILPNGEVDASYRSPFIGGAYGQRIYGLSSHDAGPVFIAGEFKTGGPVPRAQLARLNPDGTLDHSFLAAPIPFMSGAVLALPGGGCLASSSSEPFLLKLRGDGLEGSGSFALETDHFEVSEADVSIEFTVRRYWGHAGVSQVEVRMEGLDATDGEDFIGDTQTLQFTNGETRKTVRFSLINDERTEDLETARIVLQNPGPGSGLGPLTSATVAIVDDDGPSSEDRSFQLPADGIRGRIRSLAVQSDGRILVAGDYHRVGIHSRAGLARLESDGRLDLAFDPVPSRVYGSGFGVDFVRVRNSEIFFSGDVGAGVWPDSERMVATSLAGEVLRSGTPLTLAGDTFGLSGAVPYGADQWIVFGTFSTGALPRGLARIGNDLVLDPTFRPASLGLRETSAVAVESDGRVLVARTDSRLHRVSADGASADPIPLPLPISGIHGLASLPEGRFLAWGLFGSEKPHGWHPLIRCLPDGRLDPGFQPELALFMPSNTLAVATQLTVDPEGRLLLALHASPLGLSRRMRDHLIRLLPDGALDRSFEPVTFNVEGADNQSIHAITLQPDGAILVGGEFDRMNGLPRMSLVRLKGAGAASGRIPAVRSLSRTPAGISDLRVSAAPLRASVLERSADLRHWEPVSTNWHATSQASWQDRQAIAGNAPVFYRVVQDEE